MGFTDIMDLLLILVIAWFCVIGWIRGRYRALIDACSSMITIFFVTSSVPLLKDMMIDGEWRFIFQRWIQFRLYDHVRDSSFPLWKVQEAVPTGLFTHSATSMYLAERIYDMVIIFICALALIIGIQLILQVYETLWSTPKGTLSHRGVGMMVGFIMGIFSVIYLVNGLGLLSWLAGMEFLDEYISRSFFVHLLIKWLPWFF